MKALKKLRNRICLAAGLLLLLTGCKTVEKHSLTYRLWDNGDLRKWSEPAPNPNLAIFEATNSADLLVQYDAFSEKHSVIKRRAYYLRRNETRIAAGKEAETGQHGGGRRNEADRGAAHAGRRYQVAAGILPHTLFSPKRSVDLPVLAAAACRNI